jgi:hypothetical protein
MRERIWAITMERARERGRAWAEGEAAALGPPPREWPEQWRKPYLHAIWQVDDLTDDSDELHRLAAEAYRAAFERWDELLLDAHQASGDRRVSFALA